MNRVALAGIIGFSLAGSVPASEAELKATGKKSERFDFLVRDDLFAGFAGDDEALARGIQKCDETLKENPKHAEAMVWRGAARLYQAGQAYRNQKTDEGLRLWNAGLSEMDEAVRLEPQNVAVRIPRAAALVPSGRFAPPQFGKPLLARALEDFKAIENIQKDQLGELGTHPKGELRLGMADVYRMLGELEKSNEQLRKVEAELPNTPYAKRAAQWLAAKPDAKLAHTCIGCHSE